MLERIEMACNLYNGTTIKDELYGPMNTIEEIEEYVGFKLEEGFVKIDDDNYLQIEFDVRDNSTWILLEIENKEDYEYIVSGAWNEPLEDEEENEEIEDDDEE